MFSDLGESDFESALVSGFDSVFDSLLDSPLASAAGFSLALEAELSPSDDEELPDAPLLPA